MKKLQKIITVLQQNHPALPLLSKLHASGFEAIVVGGAVRNALLSLPFQDIDILTNAKIEQVQQLFADSSAKIVGKGFMLCLVNGVEIASCRATSKPWYAGDFALRDLTVNAMGFDVKTQSLLDPFGGKRDLENQLIRFTGNPAERLNEDPIRTIRACRFAALISGTLEEKSRLAIIDKIIEQKKNGVQFSGERVRLELIKAMQLPKPSVFFRLLLEIGILQQILPSLARCENLDGGMFHGETVFEHCLLTGDALPKKRPLLRFTGFMHDAGKFDAKQEINGKITFYNHESKTENIEKDLQNLRFSNQEQKFILSLIHSHMYILEKDSSQKSIRKLLANLLKKDIDYRDFLLLRIADKNSNLAQNPYTFSDVRFRLKKLQDEIKKNKQTKSLDINTLALNGHDITKYLHIPPGRKIGKIKKMLFEFVLENPEMNNKNDLYNFLCTQKKKKEQK